jgi:hypothetical protein
MAAFATAVRNPKYPRVWRESERSPAPGVFASAQSCCVISYLQCDEMVPAIPGENRVG